MTRLFPLRVLLPLSLASLLLFACATSSLATHADGEPAHASACEEPEADQCIVLACDEGECGVFGCEDVDPEAVALAPPLSHGVELARYRPPFRSPGFQRNWRRAGLRDGVRPRLTFHFQYREGFLPAFPRLQGKLIRHHLFPQASEFRKFFRNSDIDIHAWTMVIPEHVHLRIHGGSGRGGAWNAAWRQFMNANQHRKVSQAEMLGKAFELAFRFDIVGPISPYGRALVPEGPQLLAP
ncbi:TIGR02269 family lipoprotein [Archangium violaceum]|uniref:SitA6 family polymorphic toxin lipoprotein n=1 Tax=Archangium violaceum TaxID=83451 RepID=UPI00194F1F7F|nr:TIGR02269 family lipoprotein [Archangium violaceum]QRN97923.1 TIGR02269 family lipoprotein [Archangium violaceum]